MIKNVWAIGRNYSEHARELGNAVPASHGDPIIFLKAGTGIIACEPNNFTTQSPTPTFQLPAIAGEIHHEVEIGFQFNSKMEFDRMTIAIDLTARDLQSKLKSQGLPWTLAKSFRDSTLIGALIEIPRGIDLQNMVFLLRVNGNLKQSGNTRDMIHSIEKTRKFVLDHFPVAEDDLLLTGTPAGVSRVNPGDNLEAEIPGILKASWRAAASSVRQ